MRQFVVTAGNLLLNLLRRPREALGRLSRRYEGDDVFRIELHRGRLMGLIRYRRECDANVRAIANAAWRDIGPVAGA